MMKSGLLGAAAIILVTALAGPATAKDATSNPGARHRHSANYQRHTADRHIADRGNGLNNNGWNNGWNDNRSDRRDTGFWPADVAADVVGGAIDTAGAIATAPFRNDSYASYNNGYNDNGWNSWDHRTYAERNGFVCQPGTWIRGEDGRRHICQ